jgi:TRAP-type C4-dicarboxylate transport system permease small subunit
MLAFFHSTRNILVKCLEILLVVVMAMLVMDVLWGVISRFLIGHQSSWTEELARVLLIWVSFLGASLAFGAKAHLGMDYLSESMHPSVAKAMAFASVLVVIAFALFILIIGGTNLVQQTLAMEQRMMALPFLLKGYVYVVVPLTGWFTIFFSLEHLFELLQNSNEETAQ